MSRNNDVFRLLVTKGNQAVLAKDKKVVELAPGQIGVFNYDTNLSIAAADPAPKNFYMAVGVDAGDGTTGDIMKSAGSHVQGKNIAFYSFRPYTPGRPMKVVLRDFTAECETEYGVKIELRNQDIYMTQGYVQFTKTYAMKTSCCNDCVPTCPSGDSNEITKQLLINVANDPTGLIKAKAIARQPLVALTHGTSKAYAKGDVVTDADLNALMVYNKTKTVIADMVFTDIEFETTGMKTQDFNSVNTSYKGPRQTIALITKVDGFKCTGVVETTQTAVYEEGAGYDLKQMEYFTKGWTESPYRVSTVNSLADNRIFNTDAAQKYDVFALTYDQFSLGGWLEYYHNQASVLAIPTADATTRAGIVAILDKIAVAQTIEPLAPASAAAVASPTTIERTTDKTPATDGIAG